MRDSATGHELNLDNTVLTPNDFKKAMKSFLAENTDTKTLNEITKVDDHFYDDFYDDDYYYQVYWCDKIEHCIFLYKRHLLINCAFINWTWS